MSELAYDISYLLESETAFVEAPVLRVAQVTRMASPSPPSVAALQDALARELLQLAELHDSWVQQSERM